MTPSWVVDIFCPLLGTIICNGMWFAPYPAIQKIRNDNDLGKLNPIPFFAIFFNCCGWTMYAIQINDYFIFFSNIFGTVVSFYYCLSCLRILTIMKDIHDNIKLLNRLELFLIFAVFFWLIFGLFAGLVLTTSKTLHYRAVKMVGIMIDIAVLIYYAAPLSTMIEVIKTKNNESLYTPTILVNLCNCILWSVYGILGIHDIFVWLPNVIGILLAISQITLKLIYAIPSNSYHSTAAADVNDPPGIQISAVEPDKFNELRGEVEGEKNVA